MDNAIRFREMIRRGEIPLGTIVSFNDPAISEALCPDLDFIWIDAEHGSMSLPIIQGHVMALKGSHAAAIVRVPWNDPVLIKPILLGYVTRDGKLINGYPYREGSYFSGGFAAVVKGDRKPAVIDRTGRITAGPGDEFSAIAMFSGGLAAAIPKGGSKWGFINPKGEFVIAAQFDQAEAFSEGLAKIKKGELTGFIDTTGKMVIEPKFHEAQRFSNGLAPVRMGSQWGYADRTGKLVIPLGYSQANVFRAGLALIRQGGTARYINASGRFVGPAGE